jgi:flagellar assembly factor FliW
MMLSVCVWNNHIMEDALKITVSHFGEIDVAETDIFNATVPVPGFPDSHRYFFIERDKIKPFKWFQSADDPNLTFVVVEPQYFFHDYKPKFGAFDLKEIGLGPGEKPTMYAIVVLPEDLTKMTANMRGPLIVNPAEHLFKQVFIETDRWSVRESIIEGIKRKEKAALLDKKKLGPQPGHKNAGTT